MEAPIDGDKKFVSLQRLNDLISLPITGGKRTITVWEIKLRVHEPGKRPRIARDGKLLEDDCEVEASDRTPLALIYLDAGQELLDAVERRDAATVREIFELHRGADEPRLRQTCNPGGCTPLMLAVRAGDQEGWHFQLDTTEEQVAALLQACDNHGNTAWHYAAALDDNIFIAASFAKLVSMKPEDATLLIDAKNDKRRTPFDVALANNAPGAAQEFFRRSPAEVCLNNASALARLPLERLPQRASASKADNAELKKLAKKYKFLFKAALNWASKYPEQSAVEDLVLAIEERLRAQNDHLVKLEESHKQALWSDFEPSTEEMLWLPTSRIITKQVAFFYSQNVIPDDRLLTETLKDVLFLKHGIRQEDLKKACEAEGLHVEANGDGFQVLLDKEHQDTSGVVVAPRSPVEGLEAAQARGREQQGLEAAAGAGASAAAVKEEAEEEELLESEPPSSSSPPSAAVEEELPEREAETVPWVGKQIVEIRRAVAAKDLSSPDEAAGYLCSVFKKDPGHKNLKKRDYIQLLQQMADKRIVGWLPTEDGHVLKLTPITEAVADFYGEKVKPTDYLLKRQPQLEGLFQGKSKEEWMELYKAEGLCVVEPSKPGDPVVVLLDESDKDRFSDLFRGPSTKDVPWREDQIGRVEGDIKVGVAEMLEPGSAQLPTSHYVLAAYISNKHKTSEQHEYLNATTNVVEHFKTGDYMQIIQQLLDLKELGWTRKREVRQEEGGRPVTVRKPCIVLYAQSDEGRRRGLDFQSIDSDDGRATKERIRRLLNAKGGRLALTRFKTEYKNMFEVDLEEQKFGAPDGGRPCAQLSELIKLMPDVCELSLKQEHTQYAVAVTEAVQ